MGAMTGDGFVHFFNEIADMWDLKKLYILKGGSGIGKSTFIKKFVELHKDRDIVLIYCSSDSGSLDGAVVPDLRVGIVDGTLPHIIDHRYPGLCEEMVDLSQFINGAKLKKKGISRPQIAMLMAGKQQAYANASKELKNAKTFHTQLEALYADCVDFKKMDLFFNKVMGY